MRDYVSISCSPFDEDCAQFGASNYSERARAECRALINQLRRQLGPEKGTASLRIKSCPHDFGFYLDVYCYYDSEDEEGAKYAYDCERELPANWDDQALIELSRTYPEYLTRLTTKEQ